MKLKIDWSASQTKPISQRLFGHNTVWSDWGLGIWDENNPTQPNPEVIDWVAGVRPGVLRFPGGTRTLTYDFRKAVGPNREAQRDPFTGEVEAEPTLYGYGEFFKLLEEIHNRTGQRPLATVTTPWTIGTPEHTAALVAYLNGKVGDMTPIADEPDAMGVDWQDVNHWAQQRHDHGHAEPHEVEFLEIGNEQYLHLSGGTADFNQSEQWWPDNSTHPGPPELPEEPTPTTIRRYAEQVVRTVALIRRFDPNIKIGAQTYSSIVFGNNRINEWVSKNDEKERTGEAWNPTLIEIAGGSLDFLVVHAYRIPIINKLRLMTHTVERILDQLGTLTDLPVAITEYGFYKLGDRLRNAIVTADMIRMGAERNLEMMLRHIIIERSDNDFANSGMIRLNKKVSDKWYRTPAWYAMEMLAQGLLPEAMPTGGQQRLTTALATRDQADPNKISIMVVGRSLSRGTRKVEFNLPPGKWRGQFRSLTGKKIDADHENLDFIDLPIESSSNKVVQRVNKQSVNLFQLINEAPA